MWLRIYQHLLFKSKFWSLAVDRQLRKLFVALTGWPSDAKNYADSQYNARDPELTESDSLDRWLLQFGVLSNNLTVDQKRTRLAAEWQAQGGQDPHYIQTTLQNAGFDVYVHEWWEPGTLHPSGGQVGGDEPPVARNPYDYLYDGLAAPSTIGDGHDNAGDGFTAFQDGNSSVPPGRVLVNKILEPISTTIGDGHAEAIDGGQLMADGAFTLNYLPKLYPLTATPAEYPYFLYIGGETFPDIASIPANRQDEFERLVLKICPLEQWVGLIIQYV